MVWCGMFNCCMFVFERKTAYEVRISDWRSEVCSSDLLLAELNRQLDVMEAAAAQSDGETNYPLNLEFHRTIVESTGNKMLLVEYLRFVKKMHLFRANSQIGRASCRERVDQYV